MGLKMAEFELPVSIPFRDSAPSDAPFLPYWARCGAQVAQNLLASSDEPIVYDHDDEDYRDNCFFFPEDCSWTPPDNFSLDAPRSISKESRKEPPSSHPETAVNRTTDIMLPDLPDIKMLDSEALGDLLEDNLSLPEITTILYAGPPCPAPPPPGACFQELRPANQNHLSVFATNGAVFAYASSLSSRQLRNLSATYGAAYTCYAKTASSGNLTGVNPASHPSSYVTAQSMPLGDVGSIVFELDDSVAVVTRIADKVLIAAVGPSKADQSTANGDADPLGPDSGTGDAPSANGATASRARVLQLRIPPARNGDLDAQHAIDRSADLARLASLNLSAEPAVLLALESKCAALGRFLGQKLRDLESPEDF
ncbi:hypothetical protein N7470_004333 [Penicillium chermesinum]|nr:hypothetical protein N7470_004333 [Penicillium chermesinum]